MWKKMKTYALVLLALSWMLSTNGFASGVTSEDNITPPSFISTEETHSTASLRELQSTSNDDPTTFCSSVMEVYLANSPEIFRVAATYPVASGYPNDLRRCLIFQVNPDLALNVEFTFLSTEKDYDFVEVYPIQSFDTQTRLVSGVGPRLMQLSGMILPQDRHLNGNLGETLMIVLRTDSNRNDWTGFRATVKAKWRDCYHKLQVLPITRQTTSFSDGFTQEYPANFASCWVLVPPPGDHIALSFTVLNTELGLDIIEVSGILGYDAEKKEYYDKQYPIYGAYSGLETPSPILGKNDEIILVSFRSDDSIQLTGFSARAVSPGPRQTTAPTPAPTQRDCASGIQQLVVPPMNSDGVTVHDGFGDPFATDIGVSEQYPTNAALCYIFQPPNNLSRVLVVVANLSLDFSGGDQVEVFPVYDVDLESGVVLSRGRDMIVLKQPNVLPATTFGKAGETLVLQLRTGLGISPGSENRDGFIANVKAIPVTTRAPTRPPTLRECATGMTVYAAPQLGEEVVISDGFEETYPDNYHVCFVLLALPGYRLNVTLENVDIDNDRIEIFAVKSYNVRKRTFRGKGAVQKRVHGEVEQDFVITGSDRPHVVSFRTDYGRSSSGFNLRITTVEPPPTFAPTPMPKCSTRMSVMKLSKNNVGFGDGYSNKLPRSTEACWILPPQSGLAFVSLSFDSLDLGTAGAVLEVYSIQSYNQRSKSFSMPALLATISNEIPPSPITGAPNQILMLTLSTTAEEAGRGTGFAAKAVSPCVCTMYTFESACLNQNCKCAWINDACQTRP